MGLKFDPNNKPAYIILFAALISAVFTAGIMALHVATVDIVERNQRALREKAIVGIFQLADPGELSEKQITELYRERVLRVPLEGKAARAFYFAFAADAGPEAEPFAYAIPLHGVGFWANIEGVLAVDRATNTILGVAFLSHSETPGLGGRITEAPFREQWIGLDMSKPDSREKFIYIGGDKPTGPADPRSGHYIDAISGATGTSKAVERFANVSIREYLDAARDIAPRMRKNMTQDQTLVPPLRGEGLLRKE